MKPHNSNGNGNKWGILTDIEHKYAKYILLLDHGLSSWRSFVAAAKFKNIYPIESLEIEYDYVFRKSKKKI